VCLIGLRLDDDGSLLIAGNRDEFAARPSAPFHSWPDLPILAGRDLQAGGT
jgi:uncharacterized protein with NRDE domain